MLTPKDAHLWLPGYLTRRGRILGRPVNVLFALADHFEPEQRPGDSVALQLNRVERWIAGYEAAAAGRADRIGRPPRHTYFFPEEQYRSELIAPLAGHCARGFGEVEVHIHHDGETEVAFRDKIERFKERLSRHGLLSRDRADGNIKYGFVHGNWSLDNSRMDGRWCGLDNEITLLGETGCYADFTMPSAPSGGGTQTRTVNSIYFADDDPLRPKSHDRGREVVFGGRGKGDLLLIQGPIALNWRNRARGIFPRVESGDISPTSPVTRERVRLWIELGIGVAGKGDTVFIKAHTHGIKPRNFDFLFGGGLESLFDALEGSFNDGEKYRLHYVTAREMANVVYAYNDGVDGPIVDLLDYRLTPLMIERRDPSGLTGL
jgi:hypothetical protein